MAATDGQITLAASRFGDSTPIYLRDLSNSDLPTVAKIVKGQYHYLGVPSLSNPSLQSTALFLSAGKKYQILAQPIKIKEGRKPTNVGPKVLIPETYSGYFELLSEDGRSTRCIDTVLDLSRKQNLRVLVRESFRCNNLTKTIHAGEILTTIYENGKYLKCKTLKDEIVNLPLDAKAKFSPIAKEESISGVHSVKNLLKKRMPVIVRLVYGTAPKGLKHQFVPELRLLGCIEVDRVFALPLQKDTDLLAVPLNTKLKLQRAKNMDQLKSFIEYIRFLEKAQKLLGEARDRLQIVDIKFGEKDKKQSSSKNPGQVSTTLLNGIENGYVLRKSLSCDSTKYIQNTELTPMAEAYNDIDQIYDYVRGLAPLPKNLNRFDPPPTSDPPIRLTWSKNKSYTTNNNNNNDKSQPDSGNYSFIRNNNSLNSSGKHSNQNIPTNYIQNSKSNSYHNNHQPNQLHHHHHHLQHHHHQQHQHNHNNTQNYVGDYDKPIPPPIETIPGKKVPEKRQRPTLPKLYVKNNSHPNNNNINNNNNSSSSSSHNNNIINNNNNNQNNNSNTNIGSHQPKIIPVSVSPGLISSKESIEPQSPLFHIRYKSLSSLQLTPESNSISQSPTAINHHPKGQELNHILMKSASTQCAPREGTLDSSKSGGRTSGDSKLPEKKTRKLSRPRSLSNLVWELRPQKEKSKKKLYVHHYDNREQTTLYL